MTRLALPNVTLALVSDILVPECEAAISHSLALVDFGALFVGTSLPEQWHTHPVTRIRRIASAADYSDFVLRNLVGHIDTDYMLLIQWDGYVLSPRRWSADFLAFDYIGAPWPQFADGDDVGNGGFSLRSHRLMMAMRDPAISLHHPEDVCIARTNRRQLEAKHGLRFAPAGLASRFSFERSGEPAESFGFHGLFNFPLAMPQERAIAVIGNLPVAALTNRDGFDLAVRLARSPTRSARRSARSIAWRRILYRPFSLRSWRLLLSVIILHAAGRRLGSED